MHRIGLDVGSTTVKAVVTDENGQILFKQYFRHFSKIDQKVIEILTELADKFPRAKFAMSGSAGMGIAKALGVSFIQEVYATKIALDNLNLSAAATDSDSESGKTDKIKADVAIELGGEDAKILFLSGGLEVRMNGTCAGGTGSFIDQMAALLGVTADEIDSLAKQAKRVYPIASRCGVFAKTDIQPLLNQGAAAADLSKSILYAIVDQTVGGLAQGRKISGNVVYLGGPLTFMSTLRECFDEILGLKGTAPDDSLYFVAKGAAALADTEYILEELIKGITDKPAATDYTTLRPLFKNDSEFTEFKTRHNKLHITRADLSAYKGRTYLGVDSGSTTIKIVIIGENGELLHQKYSPNKGNPAEHVKEYLEDVYASFPHLELSGGAATGYGEDLIVSAFNLNGGIVETAAHFLAAKNLMPDVEFVIDIGGQDMKCFKVKNGAIDDIFLNEACSSGCGSFLQTFAEILGYNIEEFSELSLYADAPVDLGSRCTVFMNSSIKQAQKDGVSVANIAAGLSYSVVKNALYKVIRVRDKAALGANIVVQGGTFLSDAVLRAFELEMGVNVIRPDIAGLMGAYGAALYAIILEESEKTETVSIGGINDIKVISREQLKSFTYSSNNVRCSLCPNNCALTVTNFSGGRRFVSGNKCSRAVKGSVGTDNLNIYDYKLEQLNKYRKPNPSATRARIGLPLQLNMFELLPYWHAFFTSLGFDPVVSPLSTPETYRKGQADIPSDTVCYPAKLVHGHIHDLAAAKVDAIFYPCLSYNFDEKISNNHYNCPVVAYYPQVIGISNPVTKFIQCFIDLNNRKTLIKTLHKSLSEHYKNISHADIKKAVLAGEKENTLYLSRLRARGNEIIAEARNKGLGIIALVGRPYHADNQVNHGIPRLIAAMGKAVVSEDCLPLSPVKTSVLNQWTYHARLYSAADFAARSPDINLVQLVSFGCGLDAVTTDEVRKILERGGKLYTQLKIDEITNLGAVIIRIKSLLAALDNK